MLQRGITKPELVWLEDVAPNSRVGDAQKG